MPGPNKARTAIRSNGQKRKIRSARAPGHHALASSGLNESGRFSEFYFSPNTKGSPPVQTCMKSSEVTVSWEKGLHARPASRLARQARRFTSNIILTCNNQVANARSILSILLLCASVGATIRIDVLGDDEEQALTAVEQTFASEDD